MAGSLRGHTSSQLALGFMAGRGLVIRKRPCSLLSPSASILSTFFSHSFPELFFNFL